MQREVPNKRRWFFSKNPPVDVGVGDSAQLPLLDVGYSTQLDVLDIGDYIHYKYCKSFFGRNGYDFIGKIIKITEYYIIITCKFLNQNGTSGTFNTSLCYFPNVQEYKKCLTKIKLPFRVYGESYEEKDIELKESYNILDHRNKKKWLLGETKLIIGLGGNDYVGTLIYDGYYNYAIMACPTKKWFDKEKESYIQCIIFSKDTYYNCTIRDADADVERIYYYDGCKLVIIGDLLDVLSQFNTLNKVTEGRKFEYQNIREIINNQAKSLLLKGGKKSRKSLDNCTVAELKEKASKRKMNVTGLKKAEIITKLRGK